MKLMTLALLHLVGTSMVRAARRRGTMVRRVDVGKMGWNGGMEEGHQRMWGVVEV